MNAKNFQEYLASTGRANSGLAAQSRMQNANNLNTSLNTLNAGEAAALADIGRRRTDAQNAYNSGLASANANIEANYIQNLLEQRNKELDRQLQERQFQEQIRQFNENLALQKAQLYSKSSGSGGGNYGGYSDDSYGYTFDDTVPTTQEKSTKNKTKKATKTTTKKSNNNNFLNAAASATSAILKKVNPLAYYGANISSSLTGKKK